MDQGTAGQRALAALSRPLRRHGFVYIPWVRPAALSMPGLHLKEGCPTLKAWRMPHKMRFETIIVSIGL